MVNKVFREGFYLLEHMHLMHNKDKWVGKDLFNKKLKVIENILKKNNSIIKRSGYEICSLCPEKDQVGLSTSAYNLIYKGVIYNWPESYRSHYIKVHNFIPSRIFLVLVETIFDELKDEKNVKKMEEYESRVNKRNIDRDINEEKEKKEVYEILTEKDVKEIEKENLIENPYRKGEMIVAPKIDKDREKVNDITDVYSKEELRQIKEYDNVDDNVDDDIINID